VAFTVRTHRRTQRLNILQEVNEGNEGLRWRASAITLGVKYFLSFVVYGGIYGKNSQKDTKVTKTDSLTEENEAKRRRAPPQQLGILSRQTFVAFVNFL
jgi:hypothetical protein